MKRRERSPRSNRPHSFKATPGPVQLSMAPMAQFQLEPQPIPDNFEWTRAYYHFTYATHIPTDAFFEQVRRATSTPILGYSFVHETAETMADDGTERYFYEHTHVAIMFKTRLRIKGSRKFDVFVPDDENPGMFKQHHPNVVPKISLAAMEIAFTQYHRGSKWSVEQRKYIFTAPIFLEQKLPPEFEWTEAILTEVIEAPTLKAACIAGQIRPRSVSDVEKLRASVQGDAKRHIHKYDPSSFMLTAPPSWTTLHIYGYSGAGKTKWALAQFASPCLIKPFNSIGCLEAIGRKFDPRVHDGLVLDEVDFRFMKREDVIALFDHDEESDLDVRFKSFTLPAGIRKIAVSNASPAGLYPLDEPGAISRRVKLVHITEPTWMGSPRVATTTTLKPPLMDAAPTPATAAPHGPNGSPAVLTAPPPFTLSPPGP